MAKDGQDPNIEVGLDADEVSDLEMRESVLYEVGYHIVPTIGEDGVATEVGGIREAIESRGGSVVAEEWPKKMMLGYPMRTTISREHHTFDTAYFGWMKFTMRPNDVLVLRDVLRANEHILRSLIIKTVLESTLSRASYVVERSKETEEGGAMSEAELDKEIQKLVTE